MAGNITFMLRNNQMTDVNVNVFDLRTGSLVLSDFPLNIDDSVPVEIIADSSGEGSARWDYRSGDGAVNSTKQQSNIRDGAQCTLG